MSDKYDKIQVEPYVTDWKSSALEHDSSIMRDLIMEILRMALTDYQDLGDQEIIFQSKWHLYVYRAEVCSFFNSDWFGQILDVYFPDCDQATVCKVLKKTQNTYSLGKQRAQRKRPKRRKHEKHL